MAFTRTTMNIDNTSKTVYCHTNCHRIVKGKATLCFRKGKSYPVREGISEGMLDIIPSTKVVEPDLSFTHFVIKEFLQPGHTLGQEVIFDNFFYTLKQLRLAKLIQIEKSLAQ